MTSRGGGSDIFPAVWQYGAETFDDILGRRLI